MHLINGEMSYIEGNFREYLINMQGISRQFLDDVDKIVEKYKDDAFVMSCLDELVSEILKFEENINSFYFELNVIIFPPSDIHYDPSYAWV